MPRSAAIVYSRSGSSRFPQKCFAELGRSKEPMIKWILSRATLLKVDVIILATTSEPSDDLLVDYACALNLDRISIIRGSEKNLVARTIRCLDAELIDVFARINGDSPFFPVTEINSAFDKIAEDRACNFVTNLVERTFPYGVSIEVLRSEYYRMHSLDVPLEALEHTTKHLYDFYASTATTVKSELDTTNMLLTVDTFENYQALNGLITQRGLNAFSAWTDAL